MKKVFSIFLFTAFIFFTIALIQNNSVEIDRSHVTTIQVNHGDTLWTIASKELQDREDIDIRDFIDVVKEINHLEENRSLRIGEQLIVPTIKEKNLFAFISVWAKE